MAKKEKADPLEKLLAGMVGTWSGTMSTWFEPGSDALVADVRATVAPAVRGGRALVHSYRTKVQGKPAQGMMIVGKDIGALAPCVSWVDSFHTGGNVQTFAAEQRAVDRGFAVRGSYATGPDTPPWGWRITYRLKNANALEIVHDNILPDGQEVIAIRMQYRRVR